MLSIQWAYALYAIAFALGVFGGYVIGINEQKRTKAHYSRLINSAMTNAYNAGFTDASTTGKKRPSGNGAK
jgi:hypothetical protein